MNTAETTTPATRRLMTACCVILTVHVLAALYFTVLPDSYLHRRRVAIGYQEHMLAGPFYRADQLEMSYHAHIQYYSRGQRWSPERDYGDEAFQLYHRRPWRYDALKQSDYAQGLFRAAYREYVRDTARAVLLKKPAWRTLQAYIAEQWLPAAPVDSIHIRYRFVGWARHARYNITSTIMDVTYAP